MACTANIVYGIHFHQVYKIVVGRSCRDDINDFICLKRRVDVKITLDTAEIRY